MQLGFRGVVREKDETLTHLQKLDALFKVMRPFCGVCTSLCLFEIKAPSTHDFDSFVAVKQRGEDKPVSLTQPRDERVGKKSVNAFASLQGERAYVPSKF